MPVNTNSPQRNVVRALSASEITAVFTAVTWESWREILESEEPHLTMQPPGFSLPLAGCLSFPSSPASTRLSVIPFLHLLFCSLNPLLMNLDHLLVWQRSVAAGDVARTPVNVLRALGSTSYTRLLCTFKHNLRQWICVWDQLHSWKKNYSH